MKVLVYPHTMEIGGSQLNAVEIAAAVQQRGHDVTVVSRPGPLVETVRQLGLPHVTLDPRATRTLSPRALSHLTALVRERSIDVVHGYEWPPGVEGILGPRLRLGVPVVCTIMSGDRRPVPAAQPPADRRHRGIAAPRGSVRPVPGPVAGTTG